MARPNRNYGPRKEALAKLAFDLFIEQGYEQTTITDIMKAAGITKAAMYHYFSSKEDILDAAIEYGVTRNIEAMSEKMTSLTVEDKMLLFIRGETVPEEFMQKLIQLKEHNKDSYAAYRIRERLVHAYIPILESILIEGVHNGVYSTNHPRQAAEMMVLYAKALVEPNMLPEASGDEKMLRAQVFLRLMTSWLVPSREHATEIRALFVEILANLRSEAGQEDD